MILFFSNHPHYKLAHSLLKYFHVARRCSRGSLPFFLYKQTIDNSASFLSHSHTQTHSLHVFNIQKTSPLRNLKKRVRCGESVQFYGDLPRVSFGCMYTHFYYLTCTGYLCVLQSSIWAECLEVFCDLGYLGSSDRSSKSFERLISEEHGIPPSLQRGRHENNQGGPFLFAYYSCIGRI